MSFLGAESVAEIELPRIPRIVLISSQFNKEITTTVLWLNEMFGATGDESGELAEPGMDITCLEVSVYELNGNRVLHFDQIIPIPEAGDYQIRSRAKSREGARQLSRARRARTVYLLEKHGILKPEDKIYLQDHRIKFAHALEEQDKIAIYKGKGRFYWEGDSQSHASLNSLMSALFEKHGEMTGPIQAPLYWNRQGIALSLAEEADQLGAAQVKNQ